MRLALALACVTACSSAARTPATSIDGGPPVSEAPVVFQYVLAESLGYGLLLHADRVWERFDHAGRRPPNGTLSEAGMRTFERALRSAKFSKRSRRCNEPHATYTETFEAPRRRMKLEAKHCLHEVDPATRHLVRCLEALTHGGADCTAAAADDEPSEARTGYLDIDVTAPEFRVVQG